MAGFVRRLVLVVAIGGGMALALPANGAIAGATPGPEFSAFAVSDGAVAAGPNVEYWGAQWAQDNVLLNGSDAPHSFKGFADTVVPAVGCTGSFTTRPGNSSVPPSPAVLPANDVFVLVVNSVTKSGPVISGTYVDILEVVTDPGYGPDPGHPGTGVVLGSVCGTGGGGGGSPS